MKNGEGSSGRWSPRRSRGREPTRATMKSKGRLWWQASPDAEALGPRREVCVLARSNHFNGEARAREKCKQTGLRELQASATETRCPTRNASPAPTRVCVALLRHPSSMQEARA